MNKTFYEKLLKHLQDTGQAFAFTSRGIVSREDCEQAIAEIELNNEMSFLWKMARK